ncbi:MAG: hypothetical protein M1832_000970 [Thelocarpon impressellum]|nr:MAG: hypothetical protein M1832_000970 [Thelocarpon impressellum]
MYAQIPSLIALVSLLGAAVASPVIAARDPNQAPFFKIRVQSSNTSVNGLFLQPYAYKAIFLEPYRNEEPPTSFSLARPRSFDDPKNSTLVAYNLQYANDPLEFIFSVNGFSGLEPAHAGSFGPNYVHVTPTKRGSDIVLALDVERTNKLPSTIASTSDFTACTRYGNWILQLKYADRTEYTVYDNTQCVDVTLVATNITGGLV